MQKESSLADTEFIEEESKYSIQPSDEKIQDLTTPMEDLQVEEITPIEEMPCESSSKPSEEEWTDQENDKLQKYLEPSVVN